MEYFWCDTDRKRPKYWETVAVFSVTFSISPAVRVGAMTLACVLFLFQSYENDITESKNGWDILLLIYHNNQKGTALFLFKHFVFTYQIIKRF
jgi:hypothetical protein